MNYDNELLVDSLKIGSFHYICDADIAIIVKRVFSSFNATPIYRFFYNFLGICNLYEDSIREYSTDIEEFLNKEFYLTKNTLSKSLIRLMMIYFYSITFNVRRKRVTTNEKNFPYVGEDFMNIGDGIFSLSEKLFWLCVHRKKSDTIEEKVEFYGLNPNEEKIYRYFWDVTPLKSKSGESFLTNTEDDEWKDIYVPQKMDGIRSFLTRIIILSCDYPVYVMEVCVKIGAQTKCKEIREILKKVFDLCNKQYQKRENILKR